jgi:tetratricopeptide (TPR) repeat protein
MRPFVLILILCAPAAADLSSAALAKEDVVHLRSGGRLEGKVTEKGDKIEVDTGGGVVVLAKDEVARIEKKEWVAPKSARPRRAPAKLGGSYGHPFYAFKLYLPPQWQRVKQEGSASVSFVGPRDQAYTPRMDLIIEPDKTDLAAYVSKYKEAFRRKYPEVRFPFEETLTIRGCAAYQFSAAFTSGDPPLPQQTLWTFVAESDRKYVLTFNCSQSWFERYYGAIDASMRTLRIFPLPAATTEEKKEFLDHYSKAEAAYRAGKLDEALAGFQAAAKLVPEFADIHSAVATILMKKDDMPGAEAAYRRALALEADDVNHAYNLGVCLLKQSRHDGAIETLRKAVELDPSMEPALTNLGAAYLAAGKHDLARETLQKAVAADPESATAHYNLGLASERAGRLQDAEREYRETLKADPNHGEAKKSLERLRKNAK